MNVASDVRTLFEALALGQREMIALVGAGGKTTALLLLARELVALGRRVIVTTTTAMRECELDGLGPVVMERDATALTARLRDVLARGPIAAAARGPAPDGKVAGLDLEAADALWRADLSDHVLVEADGSRGRPFKAFAPHEPQLPASTTTIIQMAGLDALGRPLDDDVVHRAELLADTLQLPLGATVTPRVFADGLALQIERLRAADGRVRIVTVLNKIDACTDQGEAMALARELAVASAGRGRVSEAMKRLSPDAVVLASLRDGSFVRVQSGPGEGTFVPVVDGPGRGA